MYVCMYLCVCMYMCEHIHMHIPVLTGLLRLRRPGGRQAWEGGGVQGAGGD